MCARDKKTKIHHMLGVAAPYPCKPKTWSRRKRLKGNSSNTLRALKPKVERTQIGLEGSREGEGVDQEKLCARRDFVGGGGERRRCGKEAAREWRGRGAGVRVLRATGSVRMVKQCVSGGGAELWRRRRCMRAAVQWSSGGGAANGRRRRCGGGGFARKKKG